MGSGAQTFAFPSYKFTTTFRLPLEQVQVIDLSNNKPTLTVTPIGSQIDQPLLDLNTNKAFLWNLFVSVGEIQSSNS